MTSHISSILLFSDGSVELTILEEDNQVTTIHMSSEKMSGLPMDDRYAAAKKRGNSYIACLEREKEVVSDLPFPEAPVIYDTRYVDARSIISRNEVMGTNQLS